MERGTMQHCGGCGCRGYFADTSAGEVVGQGGRVVATAPDGVEILLVGTADGRRTDEVFCGDCAEHPADED